MILRFLRLLYREELGKFQDQVDQLRGCCVCTRLGLGWQQWHLLWWLLDIQVTVNVTQSCPTLCDPQILQARILKWVAFPFSRRSSQSRDRNQITCIAGGFFFYQLSHKRSPRILEWVVFPFSRRSSRPRNQTGVFCIAGGFFVNWARGDSKYVIGYMILEGIKMWVSSAGFSLNNT